MSSTHMRHHYLHRCLSSTAAEKTDECDRSFCQHNYSTTHTHTSTQLFIRSLHCRWQTARCRLSEC